MPVATGTLALKRFQIIPLTSEWRAGHFSLEEITKLLRPAFISPLELGESREEASGFCHPFTGQPEITDIHSLIYGDHLLLGLRMDKKTIPATYLSLQLRSALETLGRSEETNMLENSTRSDKASGRRNGASRYRRDASRKAREAVRDRLREELICHTLPVIRIVEILWNLKTGVISLLSVSSPVMTLFEKIFCETFSVSLFALNAGTLGLDLSPLATGIGPLADLQPFFDIAPLSFAGAGASEVENVRELASRVINSSESPF